MAATWQVRVGQQLSKHYTVEQLRKKHSSGLVKGSTPCTRNEGDSFIDLSELLADKADQPASSMSRLDRPSSIRSAASSALATESVISNKHSGNPRSVSGNAAANSARVLQGLFDDASLAVTAEDEVNTSGDSDELYTIPVPSSPPTHDLSEREMFSAPPPSAVALAAARALETEERSRRDENTAARSVPGRRTQTTTAPPLNDEDAADLNTATGRKIGLRQLVTVVIVVSGIAATGLMTRWYSTQSGPPTFEDLTNGALALSTFKSDDPVTIEELHVRTQILGAQVGQLTRAVIQRENSEATVPLPELPELPATRKLPIVAFRPGNLSKIDQDRMTDFQERYANLVREKGPDGRQLDDATVAAYTGYLRQLAETVDSRNADRVSALHELSEWTKLIYLLQQKRIRSQDSASQQQAADDILKASNSGLTNIYPELSTGDMRFVDLFERSGAAEQSRLLLMRYWYHRTLGRESAERWLTDVLEIVDKAQHEFIHTSITEVDNIVKCPLSKALFRNRVIKSASGL